MAYKEQQWTELGRNGIKFELKVRDQDWKKIETIQFNPQNFKKTIKDIKNRYGIDRKTYQQEEEIQDEMNWLRKEGIL